MGEPLLFCVGATQPRVTLVELEPVVVVDPEVVDPDVVEPDVVEPEDPEFVDPDVVDPDVVDPDVVDPDVVDPDVAELPLVVAPESAAVCGAEPVVLVPVVLVAAVDEPDSPLPQPASATPKLPNTAIQTIRPDPNPRLAFCMRPPKTDFQCRSGPDTKSQSGGCTSVQHSFGLLSLSRGGASAPATPLS
jgi:hypothetical protein